MLRALKLVWLLIGLAIDVWDWLRDREETAR
jgi:hypothetical protein